MPSEHPLLRRLVDWASTREDIRAVVHIAARTDRAPGGPGGSPGEEGFDLEILLVSSSPLRYLERARWVEEIGPVRTTYLEPRPVGGGLERRVLFVDGGSIDVTVLSPEGLARLADESDAADLLGPDPRIVVDKDGRAEAALSALRPVGTPGSGRLAMPAAIPPTEAEFDTVVTEFWYEAVRAARRLRRGDVWAAARSCEGNLNALVRRLADWHTEAEAGSGSPEPGGRLDARWTGPVRQEVLAGVVARDDPSDVARAIRASMDLFGTLSRDTAARLGFEDPARLAAFARGLTADLLAQLGPG